jgi:DNA-binding transcriptional LysR family regulator
MDLRQLTFLIAVADAGAIRKAARELRMAQPPVSQALRQLESELGTELLQRSPAGITLTEDGEELVRRGRKILQDVAEAREAIRGRAESRSTLRIGLIAGFLAAGSLTAPIVERFRHSQPGLGVVIKPLPWYQADALLDHRVDVAVLRAPVEHRGLRLIPLAQEPRVLLVYAHGPFGQAESLTLDDVADLPMAPMDGPHDWCAYWNLDAERGRANVCPGVEPAADVQAVYAAVVTQGAVLTVASSLPVMLPYPLVRAVPMADISPTQVYIAHRNGDRRRSVRAFVDTALATASARRPAQGRAGRQLAPL